MTPVFSSYTLTASRAKIILHALICTLEFELAIPKEQIGSKMGIVTRPIVKGQADKGGQLPLRMRRAQDDGLQN
jgi:hypothetical protein